MKFGTDIIVRITANPTGRVVMLVKMYVETFKTDIIAFINRNVFDVTLIDNSQYHSQSQDTEDIPQ